MLRRLGAAQPICHGRMTLSTAPRPAEDPPLNVAGTGVVGTARTVVSGRRRGSRRGRRHRRSHPRRRGWRPGLFRILAAERATV